MNERTRLSEADANVIGSLANDDPARDLISEILSIVRVSHWSFARFKKDGRSDQLLLPGKGGNRAEELEHLRQEFVLQRERTMKGPKLAASLTFQEPFVSGITLVFADARREFGVLSLMRSDDLGPFTSVEIQALALALDSSTDRLSGLTIAEAPPEATSAAAIDQAAMHVLDRDMKVILTWDAHGGRNATITALHARLAERLPPIIEKAIRALVASWTTDPATQAVGVAHPVPFLTVRTQPLAGPTGLFVGVLLERTPGGQVFDKAAHAFNLSRRELETLALLLRGATLTEVGTAMHIASSTVQDHVKSMLAKTGSRNRSELIAKLLSPRENTE